MSQLTIATTWTGDYYRSFAEGLRQNAAELGYDCDCVEIELDEYDSDMHQLFTLSNLVWVKRTRIYRELLEQYDHVLFCDAEVRLCKPLPPAWLDREAVFFITQAESGHAVFNGGQFLLRRSPRTLQLVDSWIRINENMASFWKSHAEGTIARPDFFQRYAFSASVINQYPYFNFLKHGINDEASLVHTLFQSDNRDFLFAHLDYRRHDLPTEAIRGSWRTDVVLQHPNHYYGRFGHPLFKDDHSVQQLLTRFVETFAVDRFQLFLIVCRLVASGGQESYSKKVWEEIGAELHDPRDQSYRMGDWVFCPGKGYMIDLTHSPEPVFVDRDLFRQFYNARVLDEGNSFEALRHIVLGQKTFPKK